MRASIICGAFIALSAGAAEATCPPTVPSISSLGTLTASLGDMSVYRPRSLSMLGHPVPHIVVWRTYDDLVGGIYYRIGGERYTQGGLTDEMETAFGYSFARWNDVECGIYGCSAEPQESADGAVSSARLSVSPASRSVLAHLGEDESALYLRCDYQVAL